jgi:hypothetical protein
MHTMYFNYVLPLTLSFPLPPLFPPHLSLVHPLNSPLLMVMSIFFSLVLASVYEKKHSICLSEAGLLACLWGWILQTFPGLAMNYDLPIFASWIAGITHMHHHDWLKLFKKNLHENTLSEAFIGQSNQFHFFHLCILLHWKVFKGNNMYRGIISYDNNAFFWNDSWRVCLRLLTFIINGVDSQYKNYSIANTLTSNFSAPL